jgi:hypothetical protein
MEEAPENGKESSHSAHAKGKNEYSTLGHFSSQGMLAITSTASAPPTPIQRHPKPPPFGVCESVPIMSRPGNA